MAKHIDIGRLKERTKQMDEEHMKFKADRVAAGLPEEAPGGFVELSHAQALINKLRPLSEVLTEYLALTNRSRQLIPFDVSVFDKYADDLTLISESIETNHVFYANHIQRSIDIVAEAQENGRTVEYVEARLYQSLAMANGCMERSRGDTRIKAYEGDDLEKIIADYKAYYKENVEEDRRVSHELNAGKGDTYAAADDGL